MEDQDHEQKEEEEECNTRLSLALGMCMGDYVPKRREMHNNNKSSIHLNLSFALCPEEEEDDDNELKGSSFKSVYHQHDQQHAHSNKRIDLINVDKNNGRKRLRLTKDQSTTLEDSFKRHTTLNPAQKQALAEQLNLTARQVEVWFQNRRARTKLKQTEVDCEFLKKCCESLSVENSLKKELPELRSLQLVKVNGTSPLCLHLPMCHSCETSAAFGRGGPHQEH